MSRDAYVKLSQYLDMAPIGAPLTDDLIAILEILFTPEEAELAVKLPFFNADFPTLVQSTGVPEEKLRDMLVLMAKKGTVFMSDKGKFRLLPTMVGFSETPFWPGKRTETTEKLAHLWKRYIDEAFGKEIGDRELPMLRVVPVEESIASGATVTPNEKIDALMDGTNYFAVAFCPCRQMAEYTGHEHCDHSRENCFHFGSMAKYMVSVEMAREITRDEAKKMLRAAHEEGLVHIANNFAPGVSTICSCCGDCCVMLRTRKKIGYKNVFADSNYLMHVDADTCTGCGICADRCPVEAITVDDVATVDTGKCIGCGVCYPTCPSESVSLVERPVRKELLDAKEFFAMLMKG
jgi:Na+-translocating ferredoxin:NAD+ oxidoreductase subunit B